MRVPGTASRLGCSDATFTALLGRHGTEALAVLDLIKLDPTLGSPLVPGLGYLRAEAVHAVRHEQAITVTDVLARRTRALLFARDGAAAAASDVARLIGPELGWSSAEQQAQVDAFMGVVQHERLGESTPADGVGVR